MLRAHRTVLTSRTFFTGLFSGLLPVLALASGSRVGFKDAFATARGNAFVATADNPSAIYYNPAGLARQDGAQFAGNVYTLAMSSDYSGPGGSASLKNDYISIPAFYASWHPTGAPWAYGFGVYAPFGLSTEWPAASPLRTFALKNTQTYVTYNFSGAWQFSPTFSAGASVTYNRVSTDLRRALGVFSADDLFRFEGKGSTVGANLGLLWLPVPEHSFGISYSHQTSVTLKGTSSTIPLVSSETASAEFNFPEVVIAGWSWRPTPQWNVEADVDWTHWSRFGTVTVNKPSGAQPLAFNWQSGYFYELGATRYLAGGWNVSAGLCYTQNNTPDATYTPAVPDSNRMFYSLGVGYRGEHFSADLAWQYADGGTRRVTGSPANLLGATADGTYKNSLNAFSLSAAYRF